MSNTWAQKRDEFETIVRSALPDGASLNLSDIAALMDGESNFPPLHSGHVSSYDTFFNFFVAKKYAVQLEQIRTGRQFFANQYVYLHLEGVPLYERINFVVGLSANHVEATLSHCWFGETNKDLELYVLYAETERRLHTIGKGGLEDISPEILRDALAASKDAVSDTTFEFIEWLQAEYTRFPNGIHDHTDLFDAGWEVDRWILDALRYRRPEDKETLATALQRTLHIGEKIWSLRDRVVAKAKWFDLI